MITKSYIFNNLKTIESLYISSPTTKKGLFYSKLAILELCGWIEETMDDIILRCAKRHIKDNDNLDFVESEVIKRTYGFEYKKHFRRMLIHTLGIINLEKLERKFNPIAFQLLESSLETLKICRDKEAHTHLKGMTRRLDSPSVTINRFNYVYDGLKDIDIKIRKSKLLVKYK